MSIRTKVELIGQELDRIKRDADSFDEKGVKAAGTRIRVSMLAIKKMAQDIRVDITAKMHKKPL